MRTQWARIVGIVPGNFLYGIVLILVMCCISSDIGVMDERGAVSIVGRSKDMIVRGGENVYPTEVEQFLDRHPDVDDVQVRYKQVNQFCKPSTHF